MKIKIDGSEKSVAKIQAQLDKENGRGRAHTLNYAGEVLDLARQAEQALADLGLPKCARLGAAYSYTSGGAVSCAYSARAYSRQATHVEFARGSRGWFLLRVARSQVGQGGGGERLILTPSQDAVAVARVRLQYRVARPTTPPTARAEAA